SLDAESYDLPQPALLSDKEFAQAKPVLDAWSAVAKDSGLSPVDSRTFADALATSLTYAKDGVPDVPADVAAGMRKLNIAFDGNTPAVTGFCAAAGRCLARMRARWANLLEARGLGWAGDSFAMLAGFEKYAKKDGSLRPERAAKALPAMTNAPASRKLFGR